MKNLVRFRLADAIQPGQDWLTPFNTLNEKIVDSKLNLDIAHDHPWHDRFEYAIYDGVADEDLPVLQQIAKEMNLSIEYPCTRDITDHSIGKWYHQN